MGRHGDGEEAVSNDLVDLIAGFVETFGKGVSVNNLRLDSVPGWQLGESVVEWAARTGQLETYEHGMPGFGPLIEAKVETLPQGWKRHADVTRGTSAPPVKQSTQNLFKHRGQR